MKYNWRGNLDPTIDRCIFFMQLRILSILLLLLSAFLKPGFAQYQSSRIVNLKIVADEDFRQNQMWCLNARQLVADSSKKFERYFGIKLNIKSVGYWFPGEGDRFLVDMFDDLIKKVNKQDCDVVLGLTSRCCHDGDYFGLASYDRGYILIRKLSSKYLMEFTLEHELCHLFGALDRLTGDTVMNVKDPAISSKFDGLTTELVLLNKFRNFEINLSPLSKSKLKQVISIYSQIKQLNRDDADINMLLASLYLESDNYGAAIKGCQKVKESDPDYPGIYSVMGRAYLLNGDFGESIKELKTACKSTPGDYQAHSNLASAYLKIGKIKQAIEECNATIAINPRDANAYACLGYAFNRKEKYKEAKEACRMAIRLDPNLPEPHNLLGIIFEGEERIEEAKIEYLKALELNPDYLEANINLGIMYFKRSMLMESARHYKRAIEIDPDYGDAYYTLAVISFFQKQYSVAREYLKKSEDLGVEISPNFKRDLLRKSKKD